jgi:hypothetical protein
VSKASEHIQKLLIILDSGLGGSDKLVIIRGALRIHQEIVLVLPFIDLKGEFNDHRGS